MRRPWIALIPSVLTVLLAACSSPPQQHARMGAAGRGDSGDAYRTGPSLDFVDHSVGQEEVSIQAMSLVGIPYRWGGNTPDSGFDCSGLVRYVLARSASVDLPRTTAEMSLRGQSIEPDEIAPGDLIFFNTTGRAHSHVGIYVGKMRFVNAPSSGGTVRIDYVTNPYWAKHFDGIRRVAPARGAPSTPFDSPTLIASPIAPARPTGMAPTASTTVPALAAPPVSVAHDDAPPPVPAVAPTQAIGMAASATAMTGRSAPATPRDATTGRDAFEPPPQSMSAAQAQARAAGATSPDAIDAAAAAGSSATGGAFEPPPSTAATAQRQTRTLTPTRLSAEAQSPPAPDVNTATGGASTGSAADSSGDSVTARPPSPSPPPDDPIARFAASKF
jgi:NlpC/P60 family